MKTMIKEFYNEDLAEHKDQWCNDGLSASFRRMNVREEADFLRHAFLCQQASFCAEWSREQPHQDRIPAL